MGKKHIHAKKNKRTEPDFVAVAPVELPAWMPKQLADIDVYFSTSVRELMPAMRDIPKEFDSQRNPWHELTSEWFFRGLEKSRLKVKPGIDANAAFRHLKAIMGSFEPQHEHKTAGVAYLMSLWFDLA